MLGMSVQPVELERPFLIENAFSRMVKPQAVLILPFAMDIPYQRGRFYTMRPRNYCQLYIRAGTL